MSDFVNTASQKAGMPPGSLVHVGDDRAIESKVSIIQYSKQHLEEKVVTSIEDIDHFQESDTVTWVTIEGLKNVELIESIGRVFDIHPLVLEDILNTQQRPKFEEFDDYLYIVLKDLSLEGENSFVAYQQVSLLVLKNLVFIFKEQQDDMFLSLHKRLRNNKGRLRGLGADYLTYVILDTIVDKNFVIIDALDEVISSIEEELSINPTSEILTTIQRIKHDLIYIRRYISPLRDLLLGILRSDNLLIDEKNHIYFRDVLDHVLRVTESLETYRDMLSSLLDIYMSSVSNKMNEVMKVLTVFATIFIPLTFVAGIYGMNFDYMPELKFKWGYPTLWIVFIVIPIVLLGYFKNKKWL